MQLKPSSFSQLSCLSCLLFLGLQAPVHSDELALTSTYTIGDQDLYLSRTPIESEQHNASIAGSETRFLLDDLKESHSTPEHQYSFLQGVQLPLTPTGILPVQPAWIKASTAESDAIRSESLIDDEAANPSLLQPQLGSKLPTTIQVKSAIPSTQQNTLFSERKQPTITTNPQLATNPLAQVPEVPPQGNEPGRRPRMRTEPITPEETPLDLRQEILTPKKIYSPSITILTPSAYGKSWRQASVGFGVQHRTRFTDSADGAFGVGFGLGDARKYVGLDVGLTLTDLDAMDRGIISFKIHRQLPDLFAVAVGVNDAITWGDGDVEGPSPYGVVSKTFVLKKNTQDWFSRIYLSLGAGTGRYRTEDNIFSGDDTPGVFGSVALRVVDPMNVIAEWSGQDLTLGLSLRPFRQVPLIFTPAVTDITGTAGDGARFIFGIGYAISF